MQLSDAYDVPEGNRGGSLCIARHLGFLEPKEQP